MEFIEFSALAKPYTDVSHETFMKLQDYVDLLVTWQSKINLVSETTLSQVWSRHILDSLQILPHLTQCDSLIDLGSGAGLPGLILAISSSKTVTLVESDQRKTAFLHEASRVTQTMVTIRNDRVEAVNDAVNYAAVTARAFAPLSKLLTIAAPWLINGSKGVFLKGKGVQAEITEAQQSWSFQPELYPSVSDPDAAILIVSDLRPR